MIILMSILCCGSGLLIGYALWIMLTRPDPPRDNKYLEKYKNHTDFP